MKTHSRYNGRFSLYFRSNRPEAFCTKIQILIINTCSTAKTYVVVVFSSWSKRIFSHFSKSISEITEAALHMFLGKYVLKYVANLMGNGTRRIPPRKTLPRKFPLVKLPRGKFPLVKFPRGEFRSGIFPRGKLPRRKLPRIY